MVTRSPFLTVIALTPPTGLPPRTSIVATAGSGAAAAAVVTVVAVVAAFWSPPPLPPGDRRTKPTTITTTAPASRASRWALLIAAAYPLLSAAPSRQPFEQHAELAHVAGDRVGAA